ncbi:glycosyltransferase family 4 protein [Conexibacter arvalis]|uniref:Glycosyltransferase involved in cell wall biosynthesis n=1 Tax=Conexibacter arvalis TaxID=912552 RepID=A0A840IBR7_9ACTN|nr:glycosyltransferase family 1 protein [Conexibacter arvalis]MBB4661508.1 glycosyltransferase involved in cell wall biosynthesis [Conexibacter arvalis]
MALPRRIGINALYLDPGVSGGSETYLRQLVPALAAEAPQLEIELATTRRGADALVAEGWTDLARIHRLPVDQGERARHLVTEQLRLPDLARRRGWEVLHSLANLAPIRARVPSVVTLLDLLFLEQRTMSRVTTTALRLTVLPAARRADALIAISAAARDDMCAIAGFDPGAFTVVPLGPGRDASAVVPTPAEELRAAHRLGDARVVLCVAAKRPHKNQELLVRAVPHLPRDVIVVLAGHPEGYDAQLRALADALGVAERVRFVDYLTDADLEGMWRLAACGAFPTTAEGFGLPVLEALERGVPVAASDLPVLREVGGDLPHWFDPHDPEGAAAAITAAIGDGATATRGPAHAERFSWRANARQTLAVYERVAAAAGGR